MCLLVPFLEFACKITDFFSYMQIKNAKYVVKHIFNIYLHSATGILCNSSGYLFRENRIFAILSVIISKFSILNALFSRLYPSFFLFR